jgi:predicted nucleic acid-binding Zn ribbon protein
MPRHTAEEEEWEDEERFEAGEEDFSEADDTIPCPYCGQLIHEDSQRCPHCENYISDEDAPPQAKPAWIVVGALLCLLIVVLWILGR